MYVCMYIYIYIYREREREPQSYQSGFRVGTPRENNSPMPNNDAGIPLTSERKWQTLV